MENFHAWLSEHSIRENNLCSLYSNYIQSQTKFTVSNQIHSLKPDVQPQARPLSIAAYLKLRLRVLEQVLKVRLVPFTGLGRRLVGIVVAAEGVVARGRGVARAVGFAAGLAPDEGVDELDAGVGGGAYTETGALDVAPVSPDFAETADAVAGWGLVCARRKGEAVGARTGQCRR
jgi:hypothetical protein